MQSASRPEGLDVDFALVPDVDFGSASKSLSTRLSSSTRALSIVSLPTQSLPDIWNGNAAQSYVVANSQRQHDGYRDGKLSELKSAQAITRVRTMGDVLQKVMIKASRGSKKANSRALSCAWVFKASRAPQLFFLPSCSALSWQPFLFTATASISLKSSRVSHTLFLS